MQWWWHAGLPCWSERSLFFFSSRRRHTRCSRDWSSDVCSSDLNGTTDFDRTNFYETLPSNQLALALWLESDRMGYLPDKLDQANLSNQQDVVRNERRQSMENAPYGIVEEGMFHLLYPKGHPYYGDVMGSHEDIQSAKLEDIRNFFKLYYAPNNASLAIVG